MRFLAAAVVAGAPRNARRARGARREASASNDLRNPLVAHSQDFGNGFHREPGFMGRADLFVPFFQELLTSSLQLLLALLMLAREGDQFRPCIGSLARSSGDREILRAIPASRLA